MYKIEQKKYGYFMTFDGFIQLKEMEQWYEESVKLLKNPPKEFGVLVDMRTLKPLPTESKAKMEEGQQQYKMKGMTRSVVIVDNAILAMQFKRIARQSGIYEWERYIDTSITENWEEVGAAWIEKGTDPDKG